MRAIESAAKNQIKPTISTQQSDGNSFGDLMSRAINEVNRSQKTSSDLSKALEMGDTRVDLAEVMIAKQKSKIAFQALTEVRNKLLTAYQDVMNMPV